MLIYDTETTGLLLPGVSDPLKQPRIIDFAMLKLNKLGKEVGRYETLINPAMSISSEITKITGYTDEHLKDARSFAAVLPEIIDFVEGERDVVAHNCPFDIGMLYWELHRIDAVTRFPWPRNHICTAAIHVDEFGKRPRLIELYAATMGKKLEQKHTAMADVEALTEVVVARKLYKLGSWKK